MPRVDTLKEIVAKKRERITLTKQILPEEELKSRILGLSPARGFSEAINKPRQISLIAEIKKASPSRGIIRESLDVQGIAKEYEEAGVQAISVLTEEDFFLGRLDYLTEAKNATKLPILRKDFILEPYQIYESRLFGADAVLLIADILNKDTISELVQLSKELGMECLVEVHEEKSLKKILNLKIPLIGINNRDLHNLEVELKTTERLYPLIPKDRIVVVESGLKRHQDILFLKILGINAVLVGEALMESQNLRMKIEELMGW